MDFETVREKLLVASKAIIDCDTDARVLTAQSSWGGDPQRIINRMHTAHLKDQNTPFSDYEYRQIVRSNLGTHFNISSALLTRLQLIQTSCGKILNSWNGVSSDLNEFRFIVERYAILNDILNKIENKLGTTKISSDDELSEVSAICLNSMGTRFDWFTLYDKNFEDMKKTDYQFVADRDIEDMASKSVMSAIDRVDRARMKGLRAFYSFCCEFVHPNVGDSVSCSFNLKMLRAKDGDYLRIRNLSSLSQPQKSPTFVNGDGQLILSAYSFAEKILKDFAGNIPKITTLIKQSKKRTQHEIHFLIKKASVFERDDICPCGSGQSIKICLKKV